LFGLFCYRSRLPDHTWAALELVAETCSRPPVVKLNARLCKAKPGEAVFVDHGILRDENPREFRTSSFSNKPATGQSLWAFTSILKLISKARVLVLIRLTWRGQCEDCCAISLARSVKKILANLGQGPAGNTAGAVFQKLSHPVLNHREEMRPARPRHEMALRMDRLANTSELTLLTLETAT